MKIKKQITDLSNLARDLVATPYGSLIKTYCILNGINITEGEFVKKMKKAKFPFIDDEMFICKTLEAVGFNYDDIINKPVALCENEFNSIFCPYIINTENGEIVLLPLFKDGDLLRSQELAMANDTWKLIDWSEDISKVE